MSYTRETIGEAVRTHIRQKYKRQREAARQWGISPTMVSQVVCGDRSPSKRILEDMGLRHVESYEEIGTPSGLSLEERVAELERQIASLNHRTTPLIQFGG